MLTERPHDDDADIGTTHRIVRRPVPAARRRLLSRFGVLAVVPVLVVAAIAGWALARDGGPDNRLLVVDGDGAISLLDPATGAAAYRLPGAVASPDRSALLTTRHRDDGTVLETRDPGTGEVTGSTSLDQAGLTVHTVSPDGGAVALMPGERGADLYEPEPRTWTTITVSYTDDRPSRTYELDGNFEPEMFSLDESLLFLLEFDPPLDPGGYFVRQLDLASGEISDTGAPVAPLNPKMGGKARAQVLHPDGTHLYTLYTVPSNAQPVHDVEVADGEDPERWAFVHVIDLDEQWSYCIFLPVPIGTVDEAAVGMAISPDGTTLHVADPSTSTMARIDATELEVIDTTRVGKLRHNDVAAAVAVTPDGTVYVGSGHLLLELAPGTGRPVAALTHATPITALAVSADGEQLRVGGSDRISLVDRATRTEISVLRPPGDGTVTLLGPPQGSVTEFPLECAC
jgi:hypothetical protein